MTYVDFSSPCFHAVTFKDGGLLLYCESRWGFFHISRQKVKLVQVQIPILNSGFMLQRVISLVALVLNNH